jgi:carbon-monoxide dehydrogenase medium subunit
MLRDLGEEALFVAGGHSLIPMMRLRMAAPAHLIDLRDIAEMREIGREGEDIVIERGLRRWNKSAAPVKRRVR